MLHCNCLVALLWSTVIITNFLVFRPTPVLVRDFLSVTYCPSTKCSGSSCPVMFCRNYKSPTLNFWLKSLLGVYTNWHLYDSASAGGDYRDRLYSDAAGSLCWSTTGYRHALAAAASGVWLESRRTTINRLRAAPYIDYYQRTTHRHTVSSDG